MTDQGGFTDIESKTELTHNDGMGANKRKRDSLDQGANRSAPGQRPGSNSGELSDQATANFLAAHNASGGHNGDMDHANNSLDFGSLGHQNGGGNQPNTSDTAAAALHYSMTVPQATELSFQSQASIGDDFSGLDALKTGASSVNNAAATNESPTSQHKPAVGTDEWHKLRRDNHKEVERRRRETINEGINELAKIVPGCEKNKGSILQRAVQFIIQLKENESQNIEKWTLEKLLSEQAITELSASCDKFKAEMQRAWDECEIWKRACNNAGIVPEELKGQEGNSKAGES